MPGASSIKKHPVAEALYWVGFIVFLASVVFSWRAVTSISIGWILLLGIIERMQKRKEGLLSSKKVFDSKRIFLLAAFIYLLLQVIMIVAVGNGALRELQVKAAVFAIPLAVHLSQFIDRERGALLFHALALILILAFLYCVTVASINFNGGKTEFFYHELVSPVNGHAIYISVYVFITIVFLMEAIRQRRWVVPKSVHALLTLVLVIFLVLLASRLVIAFFCGYLIYFIYNLFMNHRKRKQFAFILLLLALANGFLLFSTDNPVKERFTELKGRFGIRDSSHPSEYLNGAEFRMLQWKLVPKILNEKDRWVRGVGIANAQDELNRKYVDRNMYQGDGKEDRGYLLYNCHNQFLQELLQTGLPGLLGFVSLCIALWALWMSRRSVLLLLTISLVLVYAFVESVLETQYGVVVFCFFPLVVHLSTATPASQNRTMKTAR